MIQKKICMLGSFAVGKTSLVSRFVKSIFSEKYLTTVGVKIDKKSVRVAGREITLVLWDLHGDDEYQRLRPSYMRGAGGYLLVADGTRRATLDQARSLHENVTQNLGEKPFLLLLNKNDLKDEWEIGSEDLEGLADQGWNILRTSAKTGQNVEEAFHELASRMVVGLNGPEQ